jgi:hypothetical protein
MRIFCALVLVAAGCAAQDGPAVADSSASSIRDAKCSVVITEEDILRAKTEEALKSKMVSQCEEMLCGAVVFYGPVGIAKAIVVLRLSGESRRAKIVLADASGIFQFTKVNPALYDLTINAEGFEPTVIDSIGVRRGYHVTVPLVRLLRPSTPIR